MNENNIKTMKLYHQVERVFNELGALGIGPDDRVDVTQLCAFDQYHYLGTDAVDESVSQLALHASHRVLEIGSGIGGPSRHLAHRANCHMTALELQPDLHQVAIELTERCELSQRVRHVCGNILDGIDDEPFDAVVSWLTFLHIPQRPALYSRCYEALKPGSGLYVEDYFERAPLTANEREELARDVFCEHVPTMDDYRRELAEAGFERIDLQDMSESWTEFVKYRHAGFRAQRERNLSLHGAELVNGLDHFYEVVVRLFSGGNLGGIRVAAWKPA